MIIKSSNPRTSKGMELNGNVLSGDTYGLRNEIKTHWGGQWNGQAKTWTVDAEKVIRTIEEQKWGFTKILSVASAVNLQPQPAKVNIHSVENGWCNRCQDWTHGDCGHTW